MILGFSAIVRNSIAKELNYNASRESPLLLFSHFITSAITLLLSLN